MFIVIIALIAFAPAIVFAQTGPTNGIVPCGYGNLPSCDLCQLYVLAKNGVDFMLFDLILPVAIIALLIGGIFLLASRGNPQMMETGKKAIFNTVIGVIIAFAAWLIIATIANTLGYTGFTAAWNVAPTCQQSLVGQAPTGNPGTNPPPPPNPGTNPPPPPTPSGTLSEDEARARLTAAGIQTKGVCPPGTSSGCVNLGGIRESTLQEAIDLKRACGCDVFVSGGTEPGHASGPMSHGNGYKIDIRPNSQLDAYITSTFPRNGSVAGNPRYTDPATGTDYVREGDHWDITVP